MRYTDQEDGDSEDSQRTRSYDDHQADLVLDEAHWSLMTAEQKICANTGSFTVPRDIEGNGRVKGTFSPSPRCGFSHQKYTDHNHVDQLRKNLTDDDRALLVLYSSKQESLKASSTAEGSYSHRNKSLSEASRYPQDSGQEVGSPVAGS